VTLQRSVAELEEILERLLALNGDWEGYKGKQQLLMIRMAHLDLEEEILGHPLDLTMKEELEEIH
jgi:hypothetical protein